MRPKYPHPSKRKFSVFVLLIALAALVCPLNVAAQRAAHATDPVVTLETVNHAMGALCAARTMDELNTAPIDEMQARPSLPAGHVQAVAGHERATRLLPLARELTVEALRDLAREYDVPPMLRSTLTARLNRVRRVRPEMELRDNAAVIISDPSAIHFGTIFLASLRSDEAMLSVLAHELVHIADGNEESLRPLFQRVARRAIMADVGVNSISRARAEELTCDLVGVRVARLFIERMPTSETLARRMARSVQHNCVERDTTDESHLSPRSTIRALLALDPFLARSVTDDAGSLASALYIEANRTGTLR